MTNSDLETATGRNSLSVAHYANYQEYNKILRTWLVAFGIGALSLFLIHPELFDKLKPSGSLRFVAELCLAGCASQIFIAVLNKFAAWHAYHAAANIQLSQRCRYKIWDAIGNWFCLDMFADCITLFAFGYATWIVFSALA